MVSSSKRFLSRSFLLSGVAFFISGSIFSREGTALAESPLVREGAPDPAPEAATYQEGDSWVTDYLRHGGNLNDITGAAIPPEINLLSGDSVNTIVVPEREDLPSHFDWREEVSGGLPPARHQGGCGSCWAFSITAVVEALQLIENPGPTLDLSEQSLVSCSGKGSCSGGWFNAFDYAASTGLAEEVQFPYKASQVSCKSGLTPKVKISKWAYLSNGEKSLTTAQLKTAIRTYGPIATVVNASFTSYQSGIYNSCNSSSFNHMVTLEGWSDDEGGYWIMRNSWGTEWGEAGYMRIRYTDSNGNKCNRIGEIAAFAVLTQGEK